MKQIKKCVEKNRYCISTFVISTNSYSYHELKQQYGNTPLHFAALEDHTECLSILVAHPSITDLPSMQGNVSMAIITCIYSFESLYL